MLLDVSLQRQTLLPTTQCCTREEVVEEKAKENVDIAAPATNAVSTKSHSVDGSLTDNVGFGLDVSSYVLIITRLQEKVRVLQSALLASERYSTLTEGFTPTVDCRGFDLPLQPEKSSFSEGNNTRRMRLEWIHARDANSAMQLLQHVSSEFQVGDFEDCRKRVLRGLPCKNDVRLANNTGVRKDEEEISVAVPPFCAEGGASDGLIRDAPLTVDPVIVMDITGMLEEERRGPAANGEACDVVKKMNEEVSRLTFKNTKLREEAAEAQCQLNLRAKELERQEKKIEELSNYVEELRRCNTKLSEDCAAARLECEKAIKTSQNHESKFKEMISMMALLKDDNEKVCGECTGAQHDAEMLWRNVQRLETELHQWEHKEHELQRLRILMRFSELKKDSDQLSNIMREKEMAEEEQKRLREENRRCRTLIAEYRRRLKEADTNTVVSQTDRSVPESEVKNVVGDTSHSSSAASEIGRKGLRNTKRGPTPSSGLVGGCTRRPSTQDSYHYKLRSTMSSGFSVFLPPSRKGTSLFVNKDGSTCKGNALEKSCNPPLARW